MSRSYRKPWFIDGYDTKRKKFAKNHANKRVRRSKNVPDHGSYRKLYCQWEISDYRFQYNPHPHILHSDGKIYHFDPDPKWKTIRK